jgi:hypothetical protein
VHLSSNIEVPSCNHCSSQSNRYFIFWVCTCTLRCITCNAKGLSGGTTFPHYPIKGTIFGKKNVINIKCVFSFSLQLLSENFSLYEWKSEVSAQLCIGLHVKYRYYCQILVKLESSLQTFEKYWNIKLHGNPSSESGVVPFGPRDRQRDARTDMTNLRAVFRNFTNSSKNLLWSFFPPFLS